jgi:hypothetical protein
MTKKTTGKSNSIVKAAVKMSARVSVGAVTIKVSPASDTEVKRNIIIGQNALKRASSKIAQSGVTLNMAKNIPLFHADPENPDLFIRELQGKRQSGKLVDGKFKAAR